MADQDVVSAIGEQAQWFEQPPSVLPAPLSYWLLDPGSLTARLKQTSQSFHVDVHIEGDLAITPAERLHLQCADTAHWVREVLLYCDNRPHVYARSVIPKHFLSHDRNHLTELGTRPLGEVLFSDPDITRTGFHIGKFAQNCATIARLQTQNISIAQTLWGRRSLFDVHGLPILVMEVFLPEALAYQGGTAC